MFRRLLPRTHPTLSLLRNAPKRSATTPSQSPPPQPQPQSRLARLNRRLPKFLHRHTNALASAPLTHITAFLLLHELTAIIPLFGLAATFHYTHWLPPWFAEGAWVLKGVEMFGRYFRRKGWIRGDEEVEAEREVKEARVVGWRDRAWGFGEGGTRVVVEFATAYAIVKMLIPVRILMSVWAAPWFAGWAVVPVGAWVRRVVGMGKRVGKKGGGD
ncbi:hypothetical protein M011DRAFT_487594 [Sporormia fimetaria CBS 119925]|uniref:Uncharacterized protein n=1 Tax=Sporormia fimetaria CBS 119925 TaxID=1340428 RepID=A0A6A6V8R4_9PLEO|nr:hypothetical protein M011DRAFT_487594 [Sporormia fimetaria CBS 119925]